MFSTGNKIVQYQLQIMTLDQFMNLPLAILYSNDQNPLCDYKVRPFTKEIRESSWIVYESIPDVNLNHGKGLMFNFLEIKIYLGDNILLLDEGGGEVLKKA